MKAIIPTGGRGTRLQPITFSANKHFVPVAQKPLVFYAIEAVADAGIKEIAITYNPGWLDLVKNYLGDGSRWGLKFEYVLQEKPAGLANIVEVCEDFINGDRFLLHLGDNIFTEGIKSLVDYFNKKKPAGLVAIVKHPENSRLGVPILDKNGRLRDYLEKPKRPPNEYAIPGIYFFDSVVFWCFRGEDRIKPSVRGEYEIADAFRWLIKRGFDVHAVEYKGKWLDPGKFDDWMDANLYLVDKLASREINSKVGEDCIIKGRVKIGSNCRIKRSEIRGPVIIGDNVKIEDSYIGPYTSISSGCEIVEASLENSVVMENVKIINVEKRLDNCLIGDSTEVIGDNSGRHLGRFELFLGGKSRIKI